MLTKPTITQLGTKKYVIHMLICDTCSIHVSVHCTCVLSAHAHHSHFPSWNVYFHTELCTGDLSKFGEAQTLLSMLFFFWSSLSTSSVTLNKNRFYFTASILLKFFSVREGDWLKRLEQGPFGPILSDPTLLDFPTYYEVTEIERKQHFLSWSCHPSPSPFQ